MHGAVLLKTMTEPLFIDTETYCERSLRGGTYAYAAQCEVMLVSYAIGDAAPQVWDTAVEPMPAELQNALRSDCQVVAHNARFDRNVLRLGNLKIDIPIERWHCTAARALAHSLPGGLAKLCEIMQVAEADKKTDGKPLINLFCKPRPKNAKLRRATRDTHPEEWAEFVEYARMDIPSMRSLYKKLPLWNYRGEELALWHLDQRINDRGVAVDVEFSTAAMATIERVVSLSANEVNLRTEGEVTSVTRRDKLLKYILAAYDVNLPDLKSDTLTRRLEDDNLPREVKWLIAERLEVGQTSGKKHKALLKAVDKDGRMRGLLTFCGAHRTGRWAGQTFQPQNLTRPPWYLSEKKFPGAYDQAIEAIKAGACDLIYDKPLEVVSGTVRGALIAPPGRKLVISDLANIEGRYSAWTCGEEWKLKKFREYDAGTGDDLYKVAYAEAFQVDVKTVDDGLQRQIGKVMELMLQYEGGVGAFLTGAATYGIDLDELAEKALPTIPSDVRAEAEDFLTWQRKEKRNDYGLPDDVFVACDSLKRLWRRAHYAHTQTWKLLKSETKFAINNPGTTQEVGNVKIRYASGWLGIKLPSGRTLCYPRAHIDEKGRIVYEGTNQYTRQWGKVYTYGGKLLENIVQAGSRDVMADAMPLIDRDGFQIVLSVHDELVTETPDSKEYNAQALSSLLSRNPSWAQGLPLAAAGFETYRYRKE
jgi:DNA polymerase